MLLLDLHKNNHLRAMKEYYEEKIARLQFSTTADLDNNSDDDDDSAALKELEAKDKTIAEMEGAKIKSNRSLTNDEPSGRSPGRLPKNIVNVMQNIKK